MSISKKNQQLLVWSLRNILKRREEGDVCELPNEYYEMVKKQIMKYGDDVSKKRGAEISPTKKTSDSQ